MTHNTPDSNEFERFALSEGSSLVSGPTVENAIYMRVLDHERIMARASVAAVEGDAARNGLRLFRDAYDEAALTGGDRIVIALDSDLARGLLAAAASSSLPAELPVEQMTDEALVSAKRFHEAQVARFGNELAKVWRLRVRTGNLAQGDQERADALIRPTESLQPTGEQEKR